MNWYGKKILIKLDELEGNSNLRYINKSYFSGNTFNYDEYFTLRAKELSNTPKVQVYIDDKLIKEETLKLNLEGTKLNDSYLNFDDFIINITN